jgi:hypothetical protein
VRAALHSDESRGGVFEDKERGEDRKFVFVTSEFDVEEVSEGCCGVSAARKHASIAHTEFVGNGFGLGAVHFDVR